MMFNHPVKITISGRLGSGKSAVGKLIAERLGIYYYSTGGIQRKIAASRNLTTLELNHLSEQNREVDDEIDNFSRGLNYKDESFIIDSRLAWHFIDHAFKVFLIVDKSVAAERVVSDDRQSESYHSLDEAITGLCEREKSESRRYLKLYGVELYNYQNYHLVVDTTHRSIGETVEVIIEYLQVFQKDSDLHRLIN